MSRVTGLAPPLDTSVRVYSIQTTHVMNTTQQKKKKEKISQVLKKEKKKKKKTV
jgi:hypothetical protein